MKWNKYTLTTTTEAEDMISSMMMDVGIEGIEIEDKVPLSDQEKSLMFVDILPDGPGDDGTARISFYLEPGQDNGAILAAVQEGLEEIRSWGIDVGAGTIQASQTEDKDWINNWKAYFHQFYVDDILIKPSWEEVSPKDQEKLLIQIDPGTAFGTGMHETTQLCIRQLRKYVNNTSKVLDIGTGSGILGIAALKLGAGSVFGTDLDENAICAVAENLEANGIPKGQFQVVQGNIIDDEAISCQVGDEAYDIAVANILAPVIILLQGVVCRHLKRGGLFITSGIINTKEDEVRRAIEENQELEILETTYQGDWVSITARRR